jgi:hypothetical protein
MSIGPVSAPGTAESFIPVWGSGREAINDFQNGSYGWGTFNSALAASDVFLVSDLAKAMCKGIWKSGSHKWGVTRKWFGKTRGLPKGTPVHHWAIPQEAMEPGSFLETIGNQPWNLMPMEDRAFHDAVHGWGNDPFNFAERFWYGTPDWAKLLGADLAGKTASATMDDSCGCAN